MKFIILMLFSSVVSANSCVVLLYHNFSDKTPKSTSISPALFEQHLQYLQKNKFTVLPLKTMLSQLKTNSLPNKCAVLTADDAYLSIAQNAYPLLRQYQMSMAVFVATDAIDKKYRAMMSWQQMGNMHTDTIQFYNHSTTHAHLLDLGKDQVRDEIVYAKKRLFENLAVQDKIFAYPYGEASLKILQQVKNLGYVAFGQQSGVVSSQSNQQQLPRFPMAADYAKMSSFKTKVNALPMPIIEKKINPIITQNPPILALEFKQTLNKRQQKNLNCFADGGVEMTWINDNNVNIVAKQALKQRRNKYNCTMPSGQNGSYYWYSVQWVNPAIAE